MAQASARRLAVAALAEWRAGTRFADAIIQDLLARSPLPPADRAFANELFYGVLRNLRLLDFWLARLREGELDEASRVLLQLGLYQLFLLRTPQHAAVFETVELAPRRARPLVNGVLRAALRRLPELEEAAAHAPAPVRFSHPDFLVQRWTQAFGEEAALALCAWNNQPPPLYARLNPLRTDREAFLAAHPDAVALPERTHFFRLPEVPREALARGECYIQDPSTAVACELLAAGPNETILDACAAPGGKAALLAGMMQNQGALVACDRDPQRVRTLRANLQRLGATCVEVRAQDWATALAPELVALRFDRILVDAPCSNTGVMRRRVDVRWRLRPGDFVRMPNEQYHIVQAVLPLLRAGGTIVYSTCSLEPEENEQLVARLLCDFPNLALEEESRVLPFRDLFDGAYAARLRHGG